MSVRVRFAPSPTGPLHIGGVRTALYNYLFAKKHGGDFLLRIEDTDQQRFVPGAEEYIIESLHWCGISPNEGEKHGGNYGPYKQSERKDIYTTYVQELIDKSCAYYAFDTPEELEQQRNNSENWKYDYITRYSMKNSLTLSEAEVKNHLLQGTPYVVRLKVPKEIDIQFEDIIRGNITINTATIDDKVMFKSDGLPTYHLANVVDDYLMKITHVIRGEEWLPSTPIHVLLYTFFGWKMPKFAHLPLILKPDGKGKLSKRDGDKLGMPVFPLQWVDPNTQEIYMGYRDQGYSKEAFINMLAFLGWNPGTEKEIYTLEELVKDFSLEKVHKSGAKFDPDKTKWFNQQHIKLCTDVQLKDKLKAYFLENSIRTDVSEEKLEAICALMKERVNFIHEIYTTAKYLFENYSEYDIATVQKKWDAQCAQIVQELSKLFSTVSINNFVSDNLENIFKEYIQNKQIPLGKGMISLRLALTGQGSGPILFQIMEVLGKDICLERLSKNFMWEK